MQSSALADGARTRGDWHESRFFHPLRAITARSGALHRAGPAPEFPLPPFPYSVRTHRYTPA